MLYTLAGNTDTSMKYIQEYYFHYRADESTEILGKGRKVKPAYKRMESSIAPDFVHSYDSCVLKSAFGDWNRPLVVVHDCFKVLPNDMDLAKERIRHGFVHVCSGDPLARLADDLGVSERELPRLKQGEASLEDVLNSSYIFN